LEREKLGSTSVGHGAAIPHGKIEGIPQVLAAFGRSRRGIDFQAHDHRPAHLFFVLLAPAGEAGAHLQALARLSRLLKSEIFRESLLVASGEELFSLLIEEDSRLERGAI
jgi:PTS system nitrogen regulatory IIA component